jgi:small subunit ribosomal protein S5
VPEPTRSYSGPPRGNRGPGRGPRRARSSPDGSDPSQNPDGGSELSEKVVFINRSAKVVKGGRRFSFSALVVAGDKHGRVGVGLGKAVEVSEAIRKGGDLAKQHMIGVSLKDATIPHEILSRYGGAKVLLRPASPGTGIIAGKTVRAVLESVGIKDILSKSLGSNNPSNVVKATLAGLQKLRLREDIYRARGLEVKTKTAPKPVPPSATAGPHSAAPHAAPAPQPVVQTSAPAPVAIEAVPVPAPAPAPIEQPPASPGESAAPTL